MPYVALGLVALAVLIWFGGARPRVQRREWRLVAAAFALAAFVGAGYAGVRGEWLITVVLVIMGLGLASSARGGGAKATRPPPRVTRSRMSADEARRILGVEAGASRAEILAAHKRLMRMAHPDAGGTAGLAAQLNAARDVLLGS
jgi:hypothetical protein